jgi:hypothetical protein
MIVTASAAIIATRIDTRDGDKDKIAKWSAIVVPISTSRINAMPAVINATDVRIANCALVSSNVSRVAACRIAALGGSYGLFIEPPPLCAPA